MYGNSFFNPYMYQPYQTANLARGFGNISNINNLAKATNTLTGTNTSLNGIKGLLGKFSFSGLLDGASKTLNVVNQAIPIFYQVKPMFNNAKTMFRILGAVKEDNNINTNKTVKTTNNNFKNNVNYSNTNSNNYDSFNEENPTFFI